MIFDLSLFPQGFSGYVSMLLLVLTVLVVAIYEILGGQEQYKHERKAMFPLVILLLVFSCALFLNNIL